MPPRFSRGAKAYNKDGRLYRVEEVEGGTIYCTLPNGAETEFPETSLLTESEWKTQSEGRLAASYTRLKHSRAYAMPATKLDRAAAERLLVQAERLMPSILDFTAYTTATHILSENQESDLVTGLSIVKCRNIYDSAAPEIRASLLAMMLGLQPELLLNASGLGDNMACAMFDKGMAPHLEDFDEFQDRPRR
jgi:hypothetical protein